MNFNGKVALVTGASVGIGRAVALMFAEKGAKTILIDINYEKLEKVKGEVEALGGETLIYNCDVSNEEQVNFACADAEKKFGKIDILINNAAFRGRLIPFTETGLEIWRNFFDVNLWGTVYFTRAVLPGMLDRGYGRIINIASVAGVYGNGEMVPYSASKGAIIVMTRALAKEVTDKGVLVNAVSPGSVSPSFRDDIDFVEPSNLAFIGRTGSGRENASLICYLASDEASYISGQNIQIDGCRKKQ